MTSKPEAVPAPLCSRLTHLELNLLTSEDATHFLATICQAEGLVYDTAGLALLQAAVGGEPRELLRAIEKVTEYGEITETNVRLAQNLDFLDRLTAYADALLGGDLQKQLELIEDWPDAPRHKLEFLERFFTYIYFVEVCYLRREDPIMRGLSSECRATLLRGMAERAGRLHLDEAVFWKDAIAALAPRDRLSAHGLAMLLTSFHRLMNALPDPGVSQPIPMSVPQAPRRLRIARVATGSGTEPRQYLPWNEIKPIWQAGSFVAQHYGALLNLRLAIRHADIGRGADLTSRLTHELGMRFDEWQPDAKQFHWIYRHEADEADQLVTRLMMSVPEDHLTAALHWIRSKFPAVSVVFRNALNLERLLRFHWAGIRVLSRSLDPTLLERSDEGERVPLVDLLRIPRRWRGPTGTVHCAKRRGASMSLREPARIAAGEGMPFLSALNDCAWQALDQGWELASRSGGRSATPAGRGRARAGPLHRR